MSIRRSISRFGRFLRGRVHLVVGRLWLLFGHRDRARQQFRDVLLLRGDDFRAYVELGRIALLEGNLPVALREMSAARRTSPERFSRLRHEFTAMIERLPVGLGPIEGYAELAAAVDPGNGAGSSENRPFGPSPFELPADGNDLSAATWFWYLDSSNQVGHGSVGQIPVGLPDPELGFRAQWSQLWSEGRSSDMDPGEGGFLDEDVERGLAWMDSHGDDLDDFADGLSLDRGAPGAEAASAGGFALPDFTSEAFDEDFGQGAEFRPGDDDELGEDASWAQSPLAAFYEELDGQREDFESELQEPERDDSLPMRDADFLSEAEANKFRALPPIHRSELDQVNWDELTARLGNLE